MNTSEESEVKIAVQHIMDWKTGEAYFAIVSGSMIVKPLRECANWKQAAVAYREFKK